MRKIIRILLSSATGGVACAISGFLMFFIMALFDNARVDEAFLFSFLVAFFCAFSGAVIGFIVGVSNVGVVGGGLIGLLGVAIVGFTSSHNTMIIFVAGTLPMVVAGVIAALSAKLLAKSLQADSQPSPVPDMEQINA